MEGWSIPKYKRHHFVPKSIIKRFAQDNQVKLFDTGGFQLMERSNPKSIYYVDHLYSRWKSDGSRDSSVEQDLQIDHENQLTDFIDSLLVRIRSQDIYELSSNERSFLVKLCLRLLLRNPTFVNSFIGNWRFRVAKALFWLRLKVRPKAISAIRSSKLSTTEAAQAELRAYAATVDISTIVSAIECTHKIAFFIPRNEETSFILGSQPYLLQRKKWFLKEENDWEPETGPMDVYAVLDPGLMVGVVSLDEVELVQYLERENIQRINGLIIKYSDEIVARATSDLEGAWYRIFDGEHWVRERKQLPAGAEVVKLSLPNSYPEPTD